MWSLTFASLVTYLVEGVEELRNQWGARAGVAEDALETKLIEVADEAVGRRTKSQRVAPEVPLESDDGCGEHADPDEGERGLSARKTRVEERETRHHDHDHGRGHENVGLVTWVEPLVQVLGD